MKLTLAGLCALLLIGGYSAGAALTGEHVACDTASAPAHTVGVDGTGVYTTPGATTTVCVTASDSTTTVAGPTTTVTSTVTTTTGSPPPPPPPPSGGELYGFATGAPSIINTTYTNNASTRTACSAIGTTDPYVCYARKAKSIGAQALRGDAGPAGSYFDRLHDTGVAEGLSVVPSWNMKATWTNQTASDQASMIVSTYPDTRRVELGNEPNGAWSNGNVCTDFPNWPVKITGFVKTMSPILRNGLPGVYIISPGLADYGLTDSCHMTPQSFLTAELDQGIDPFVDCYGYHPYSDFDWQTQLPQMVKILRDRGITKPLCLTETGVDTLGHTEAAEASAITSRLNQARSSGDIADVYWYSQQDHCSTCTSTREDRFGVFHTDWSKKPAADAFALAVG